MRKDRPCILKTEDITMQFGGVVAVNNFSMEEYEGEIVAIIGPTAPGKPPPSTSSPVSMPPPTGASPSTAKPSSRTAPAAR